MAHQASKTLVLLTRLADGDGRIHTLSLLDQSSPSSLFHLPLQRAGGHLWNDLSTYTKPGSSRPMSKVITPVVRRVSSFSRSLRVSVPMLAVTSVTFWGLYTGLSGFDNCCAQGTKDATRDNHITADAYPPPSPKESGEPPGFTYAGDECGLPLGKVNSTCPLHACPLPYTIPPFAPFFCLPRLYSAALTVFNVLVKVLRVEASSSSETAP